MGKLLTHAGGMLGMRLYICLSNSETYWNTFKEYNYAFPNIRFRNITKTEKLFDMWQRAGPSMITPQLAVPKTPDSSGAGKLALSSFHIRALQSGASPYWNFQYKELKESENALSLTQEERRRLYKTSMIIVQQPIFNFLLTWKSSKCIVIPKN